MITCQPLCCKIPYFIFDLWLSNVILFCICIGFQSMNYNWKISNTKDKTGFMMVVNVMCSRLKKEGVMYKLSQVHLELARNWTENLLICCQTCYTLHPTRVAAVITQTTNHCMITALLSAGELQIPSYWDCSIHRGHVYDCLIIG